MILEDEYIKRITRLKEQIIGSCVDCGGTGFLRSKSRQEDDAALAPEVERCICWRKWTFRCSLTKAGLPAEFHEVESIRFEYNRTKFQEVRVYTRRIAKARENGLGFVFLGDNGAGKTSAAALVICKAIRAGFSAYYTTFQQLILDIQRGFKDDAAEAYIAEAMQRDFLVLDEVDKEYRKSDSTWVLSQFDSLLRRRRGDCLPTILISNCEYGEISERYGPSVASLIRSRMKVLNFEPGDYRRKQGDDWDKILKGNE